MEASYTPQNSATSSVVVALTNTSVLTSFYPNDSSDQNSSTYEYNKSSTKPWFPVQEINWSTEFDQPPSTPYDQSTYLPEFTVSFEIKSHYYLNRSPILNIRTCHNVYITDPDTQVTIHIIITIATHWEVFWIKNGYDKDRNCHYRYAKQK